MENPSDAQGDLCLREKRLKIDIEHRHPGTKFAFTGCKFQLASNLPKCDRPEAD
ncbi:hypothetical protein PXK58_20855 [Phaeobacter gallaeciensis]|jgi:hypothetical protein|uniref:hypothetical protein n=1 Tax=Phaeobacter gallaeciensis TaxID=60890 RepID=UPI0023A9569E|nr:hypothetical protein [Phaeobacter gallaeciensis]MDE4301979.1 hypothetical protein [Phaeobacter gallaeciensis]MDE5187180.1 hypothetical protein [Phaeobacter gallaeciensis]